MKESSNLLDYAQPMPRRSGSRSILRMVLIAIVASAVVTVLDHGPQIVREIARKLPSR